VRRDSRLIEFVDAAVDFREELVEGTLPIVIDTASLRARKRPRPQLASATRNVSPRRDEGGGKNFSKNNPMCGTLLPASRSDPCYFHFAQSRGAHAEFVVPRASGEAWPMASSR
jgi:hypothetical protein